MPPLLMVKIFSFLLICQAWYLDINDLKKAITPKTKVLLINTPHNPTGKIFSRAELEEIANVVKQHPKLVVITDEVYEWITFQDEPLPRICQIPGMWERTLNVSSGGKTFSTTGWKIGWVYGPQNLVEPVSRASQFTWFSVSTPMQEAIAVSFETALNSNYLEELKSSYTKKKNFLLDTLSNVGLNPLAPQGTFFILCDIKKFSLQPGQGDRPEDSLTGLFLDRKDWNFCRWLTSEIGVTAIPCSAFYAGQDVPQDNVRFAFCKTDEDLEKARERLQKLKQLK